MTESSQHEPDRGEMEESERGVVAVFPVLGESTAAVEPCDRVLDNPPLGFDGEAVGVISTFDDLHRQAAHRCGGAILEHRSGMGTVGKQFAQEGELTEQGGQQQDTAVAVLNIGASHERMQHQAQRVDQDVALLTFDQLAGIKAVWVDAGPPCSALFTLWLSITQALGLASRSACSRHLT